MRALIAELDPYARPGHTGYRLTITKADRLRVRARRALANSDDLTVQQLIAAASDLCQLLHDATESSAVLRVELRDLTGGTPSQLVAPSTLWVELGGAR